MNQVKINKYVFSREYHGNEVGGKRLTSREAGPLVAAGELNIEVGDQGMDIVVPLDLQTERRREGQIVYLHRVDVHLLWVINRSAH